MEQDEYAKMAKAELVLWWYRALHANLIWLIRRYAKGNGIILDAGCGSGGLMAEMQMSFPGRQIVGVDLSPLAAAMAAEKKAGPTLAGDVNQLPIGDSMVAVVVSADVLYHRDVRPADALREFARGLSRGGVCIVNVPAYEWLRSYHDTAIMTARRFDRASIRSLLADAGFAVAYCGYWNTLLFPLMVIRRKLLPAPPGGNDVVDGAGLVNFLFRAVLTVEHLLLRTGLRLPFGGSCIAVGVKK